MRPAHFIFILSSYWKYSQTEQRSKEQNRTLSTELVMQNNNNKKSSMPYQMCKPASLTPKIAQNSTQSCLPSPDFTWNMSASARPPPLYCLCSSDYTKRVGSVHQQFYQLPSILHFSGRNTKITRDQILFYGLLSLWHEVVSESPIKKQRTHPTEWFLPAWQPKSGHRSSVLG